MGITIAANTAHIWRINLDQPEDYQRQLAGLLASDETARAAALYFDRDRRRFTVARGVLRLLLARYTGQNPQDIAFDYNPHGKPSLRGCQSLRFNLSHSNEWAVCALGSGTELGIDIEYMRSIDDMAGVARSTFSPTENAVFASVPQHLKMLAFFNCWTRKEAYIKAIGEGLSHPLDSFDVTLIPGDQARVLCVVAQPDEASRWTLYSFTIGTEYQGALASRQPLHTVNIFDWSFDNFE